jgi:hypothetical protein
MSADLPYLVSYKNVGALFERIAAAKAPDAFTTTYLANTLGLKSTTDRALISLLKALGFIDPSGKPTPEYLALKNPALAPIAIAKAIRHAYAPLFEADEKAQDLESAALKGLIAQTTGADTALIAKIFGTLQALLKNADFSAGKLATRENNDPKEPAGGEPERVPPPAPQPLAHAPTTHGTGMRPEFHYNIQIHLPANGTEETYLQIFNAMRRAFVT